MRVYDLLVMLVIGLICVENSQPTDELEGWMLNMVRTRRCYGDLGCFDLQNPWFSWSRPIPVLPQSRATVNTTFYLINKSLKVPLRLQTRPIIDIPLDLFKCSTRTIFIVHGYISSHRVDWIIELVEELLKLYNVNIVLVDWANGANTINYIQAVANTRLVGAEMARFARYLVHHGTLQFKQIHVIGFSLGSHIASYMAKNITELHRITAFDPAQPGFEDVDPLVRLDSTDADFVDVIHTNGVALVPGLGFGMIERIGNVDFYVNGGETQPGCRRSRGKTKTPDKKQTYQLISKYLRDQESMNIRVDSIDDLKNVTGIDEDPSLEPGAPSAMFTLYDFLAGKLKSILDLGNIILNHVIYAKYITYVALFNVIFPRSRIPIAILATGLVEYVSCSHKRAPQYFVESLRNRNCSFWGIPWDSYNFNTGNCTFSQCTEMGIHSILYPARGKFYVQTNIESPFCSQDPGIEATMKNTLADKLMQYLFN